MGKKEAKGEEKEKDCSGKEDGPITVVFKIEMHCDCCAQKVRRSVKGLKGVEAVASDISANKLTVIGKVNPIQLRGLVEIKTHKNVELVSPAVSGNPKGEGKGLAINVPKLDKGRDKKKTEDKKSKEPTVTSVVLKIRLHCHGCIRQIRKQAYKIKGVDSVSIDEEKELVIVKGTMDAKSLPELLSAKLKKPVEIVNPKKKDEVAGENEKGDKKKGTADGAKEKEELEAGKAAAAAVASTSSSTEVSKMEFVSGGGAGDYPYRNETIHAPQFFSDENPNACSIM